MTSSSAVVDRITASIEALTPFLADARRRAEAWKVGIQVCISDPEAPYIHVDNKPDSGHGRMVAAALQARSDAIGALAALLRDAGGPRVMIGLAIDVGHDAERPFPVLTPILRDNALQALAHPARHMTRAAPLPLANAADIRVAAERIATTVAAAHDLPACPDGSVQWIGGASVTGADNTVPVQAATRVRDRDDFLHRFLTHATLVGRLLGDKSEFSFVTLWSAETAWNIVRTAEIPAGAFARRTPPNSHPNEADQESPPPKPHPSMPLSAPQPPASPPRKPVMPDAASLIHTLADARGSDLMVSASLSRKTGPCIGIRIDRHFVYDQIDQRNARQIIKEFNALDNGSGHWSLPNPPSALRGVQVQDYDDALAIRAIYTT